MKPETRRTRIVATIGPATDSPEMLEQLIAAGMNVARLNMSHATREGATAIVQRIREIAARRDQVVAILMDTQGPAIRTGDLPTDFDLKPGEQIALTVRGQVSEELRSVDVNYDHLVDDIAVGDVVLVDNGVIQLKVLAKQHNQLQCEVLTEGTLGSRRHINLPGVRVSLPALTEKDLRDVELGLELGVDFFAMSFVREAKDVRQLRELLDERGAPQRIVAKLEDQQGLANIEDIIDAADGVMVARGDLGIECPYEELPMIQRRVVKRCLLLGKPVIVATHMLESMVDSPSPTRAEITDVANAVFEHADAIMLSGETSVGQYPLRCLEIMDRIARRVERSGEAGHPDLTPSLDRRAQIMRAAARLAEDLQAPGLCVFTRTGTMARYAAWMRPACSRIHAFTDVAHLQPQLALHWGTQPHLLQLSDDTEQNVLNAIAQLKDRGHVQPGDTLVFVTLVKVVDQDLDSILVEKVK